jgi:hypothetical protein
MPITRLTWHQSRVIYQVNNHEQRFTSAQLSFPGLHGVKRHGTCKEMSEQASLEPRTGERSRDPKRPLSPWSDCIRWHRQAVRAELDRDGKDDSIAADNIILTN